MYKPDPIVAIPAHLVEDVRKGKLEPEELGAYVIMIDAFQRLIEWPNIEARLAEFPCFGSEGIEMQQIVQHLCDKGRLRGANNLTGHIAKAAGAKAAKDTSNIMVTNEWVSSAFPLNEQGKVVDYLKWCKSKDFWPRQSHVNTYIERWREGQTQSLVVTADQTCDACYGSGQSVTYDIPGIPTYNTCTAGCDNGVKQ